MNFFFFKGVKRVGMATAVIDRAVKPADFLTTKNRASVMKIMAGAVTVQYP